MKVLKYYNAFNKPPAPIKYDIAHSDDPTLSPYLTFTSEHNYTPNISSHTFVDIMGYNQFISRAKAILKAFKLIDDGDASIYYKIRGGVIEVLALEYIKAKYPNTDAKPHELSDFKNFNQFPNAKPFTGVCDITMTLPTKMSVEVKSKENKNLHYIRTLKKYPENEVMQGEFLGELFGADHYMMLWGFISEGLEYRLKKLTNSPTRLDAYLLPKSTPTNPVYDYDAIVRDMKLSYTHVSITWHEKIYPVRHDHIRALMKEALDLRNHVALHKRVPVDLFSEKDFTEFVTEAFNYKKET